MEVAGWQGARGWEMCCEQPSSKMNKTISASDEPEEDMRENNYAVVMGVGGGEGLAWIGL